MLHVVLVEPEIAPNVGNVARLCAATDSHLHLVGPLGFRLDDRALKRAGVDYWDAVAWTRYVAWEAFWETVQPQRIWKFTAHATRNYATAPYAANDFLIFGSESRGLPPSVLTTQPEQNLVIPVLDKRVRSLNLATAVGIGTYEALRQIHGWRQCRLSLRES